MSTRCFFDSDTERTYVESWGDAAANLMGLSYMLGHHEVPTAQASLAKLTNRDFEAAVFGHGKPI